MKLRSNQVITATDVVVDQIGKIIGYRLGFIFCT